MKWLLLVAVSGLLALGAGCTESSQAFEVTSPDGAVMTGNSGLTSGITAPVFTRTPNVSGISGPGAVQ